MKEAAHFDSEHEFREWFDKNLSQFGIRSIVLSQEVCPDYVVIMESGETKKVEAELIAINFRYHKHSPAKVDFIVAAYAKEDQVDGVPVIAVNWLWEYRPDSEAPQPPPEGPLSDDELRMLDGVQFTGGIDLSALGHGDFAGQCRVFLPFPPDSLAAMPRGGTDDGLFGVLSSKAKKFIKKYHYAVIGAGLSERACAAFDSLSRRGLIKTQPMCFAAAAYDGVMLTHPGWIPTEVLPTEKAREYLKGSLSRMFGSRPSATSPPPAPDRP
jgi:hypothetical protein